MLYVVVNSSARSALYSHVGTLQGNAVNRFDNAKVLPSLAVWIRKGWGERRPKKELGAAR